MQGDVEWLGRVSQSHKEGMPRQSVLERPSSKVPSASTGVPGEEAIVVWQSLKQVLESMCRNMAFISTKERWMPLRGFKQE